MKTSKGKDLMDVEPCKEITGNSVNADTTIVADDDNLDKILSNMEKISSGHFGSVCE